MFKKKFPSLSSLGSDGNTAFLRAARAGHLDKVLEHLKANIDINTSNTNGLNALHLASKDGHVNVVTELLKRGAVVDSATKKGNTALHIASLAGQEDVVKLLVANGASVNVQSQNGFTPLYMAAQENHDNVVRFLLANGANQSLATEDGFTPLAVAMQQGHDKVVAVLLENDTRGKVRLPALHIAAKKDDCKAAALLLQNDHNPDVTSKSGFTPLHIAAHYGNEGIGNLLLNRGADVNYSAKHNISPLHVAAKWGKTNLVSLLLEKGANIESKTRDGLTPLHCAARSGHEQVVDMMLERGAPISSKTKNGLAPLHMAAQGDHVDAARILLYHRAPVDEVTVDYLTALHVAAHCGHVRVAKLLLDRKADPNARALNGFTPLHIACKKNRIKVVELLLKHGASIEATTESGLTPLHVASFMGCMNIVIFLLQNDASPDVPTVRGETPLHLAARANQTDIIRILLRNGAQVDARAREQQTPLHIASRLGNVDIVMLLLQHGAAVDSTTKDMYTALHIAAKEGQEEVASVLLEHGASLTATTKKGFTPLHLAAKYGNIKVAKLLLQKEAPVDAQGKNGVTPLHVASHYDHQNVALLLLDKGASPHATAKNGHTPLHIAARKNQMDIATTLLEYGAKANAESKAGFTPLHLSAQEGHNDMSTLLIEHQADTNHKAKNGLTPLHLCAQEDRVNVAAILVKNGAQVESTTKAGYTPLHVASHFGQVNMIRFLLQHGADVKATTSIGYTPLHQAAQQGHTTIVNLLLENSAPPNIQTNQGQTPLSIAQKLGYISVVETLKVVTEPTIPSTIATTDEKYRVVAPETMQETFMSDSEDEGGEDTMLSDQPYRYLTVDEMKSLGDDSLPIDVTRDERMDSNREHMAPPQAVDDTISPQHVKESYAQYAANYTPDNVDLGSRHPVHVGFLVSFLVDARGGAMRGCRHSGVRVIVPPRKAAQPMRVTCRYLKRDKLTHPPPLMEGEALASRILELGPVGAKFLGPVIIEVPHFGSLRGMEREIVILRSDNGETWREHTMEASDEAVHDVLNESFEAEELSALEEPAGRTTRILTTDFPQYFAVVSRVRQEVHAIGPEGGMVSSSVVPQVQAVFPQGALTKKIKVGLQAQPIPAELAAKLLGNRVAVSPIVTVEPRRRKFHKPITLTIPVPQAANKGMINQYSGDAPTLRLLCSITGGTTRAQWEDVTGSTPLTFVNDCVSFTTTVSARFWLMDCRNISEATKMATELYKEAIHVPFMAKFVVFAKRVDVLEARLRVFCMTDDKEDKTLEHQEHFTEVAKSRDVEVLEGKPQYVEFSGNLVPVTKSGDQLQLGFRAFRENRLPFTVRVKDPHADTVGRILFMREGRIAKGEPPQQPICILNIVLPDTIVPEATLMEADLQALNKKYSFLRDGGLGRLEAYQRTDLRLSDISNLLGQDWLPLASELNITTSEVNLIKSECPGSSAQQAMAMLRLWLQQQGNKANGQALESALRKLGREDIVQQCIFNVDEVDRAVDRVKLDQSGFDTLKEELGPSRDTSLRRNISLDVAFDEKDIMKESESVEELVLQEKVKPAERLKDGRRDSDETETKYIGEEKVVVEEQKSVSQLKEIFAADKRDRQYERQPSIGSMEDTGRPVSMVEQVTKRTISTTDDRPKSAVEIVEKTIETTKEEPEEETLSVEEIRRRFSGADDKPEKTVTTTVTKVTKKISGIPVAGPKTPEVAKKISGIPTLTQKSTEVQETITKTVGDGSKKTSEVKEVVTKTMEDGSKKVTETITQKTSGIPKITQKTTEIHDVVKTSDVKDVAPKVTETVVQKVSGIPVMSTKTIVGEFDTPKTSEFVSHTTQEVMVTTKTSGIPVVTKTTKVVETITKTAEDGKETVTKIVDGQKQAFDKSSADQRRDSELFQGVSEELGRLETTFKVAPVEDGILSPKVSKTPPPSPAEFSRDQTGGQSVWSTGGTLGTEVLPPTQEWSGKAQETDADKADSVSDTGFSSIRESMVVEPSSAPVPESNQTFEPENPDQYAGVPTHVVNKLITNLKRQSQDHVYVDMSGGSREPSTTRDTSVTGSNIDNQNAKVWKDMPLDKIVDDVLKSYDEIIEKQVACNDDQVEILALDKKAIPDYSEIEPRSILETDGKPDQSLEASSGHRENADTLIMYDSSPTFFRKIDREIGFAPATSRKDGFEKFETKHPNLPNVELSDTTKKESAEDVAQNIVDNISQNAENEGVHVDEMRKQALLKDVTTPEERSDSKADIYEDVQLLRLIGNSFSSSGVKPILESPESNINDKFFGRINPELRHASESEGNNIYVEPDSLSFSPRTSVGGEDFNLMEYFPEMARSSNLRDDMKFATLEVKMPVHVYEEIEQSFDNKGFVELHESLPTETVGTNVAENTSAVNIVGCKDECTDSTSIDMDKCRSLRSGFGDDFNLMDYFPEMADKMATPGDDKKIPYQKEGSIECDYVEFAPEVFYENSPVHSPVNFMTNKKEDQRQWESNFENVPLWPQDLNRQFQAAKTDQTIPDILSNPQSQQQQQQHIPEQQQQQLQQDIDLIHKQIIGSDLFASASSKNIFPHEQNVLTMAGISQQPTSSKNTDKKDSSRQDITTNKQDSAVSQNIVSVKKDTNEKEPNGLFVSTLNERPQDLGGACFDGVTPGSAQLEQLEAKVERILSEVAMQENLLQQHYLGNESEYTLKHKDLSNITMDKGKTSPRKIAEVIPFFKPDSSDEYKSEFETKVTAGVSKKVMDDNPWLKYMTSTERVTEVQQYDSLPVTHVNTWEAPPAESTIIELLPRQRSRKGQEIQRPVSFKSEQTVLMTQECELDRNILSTARGEELEKIQPVELSKDVFLQNSDCKLKNAEKAAEIVDGDKMKHMLPEKTRERNIATKKIDQEEGLSAKGMGSQVLEYAECKFVAEPVTEEYLQCLETSVDQLLNDIKREEQSLGKLSSVDGDKQRSEQSRHSTSTERDDHERFSSEESDDIWWEGAYRDKMLPRPRSQEEYWEGVRLDNLGSDNDSYRRDSERGRDSFVSLSSQSDALRRTSTGDEGDISSVGDGADAGPIKAEFNLMEMAMKPRKEIMPTKQSIGNERLFPHDSKNILSDDQSGLWDPQQVHDLSRQSKRISDDGVNISRVMANFPAASALSLPSGKADLNRDMSPFDCEPKLLEVNAIQSNTLPRASKSTIPQEKSSDQSISRLYVRSPGFEKVKAFSRTPSTQSLSGASNLTPTNLQPMFSSMPISKSLNMLPVLQHLKKPNTDRDDETPSPDLDTTTSSSCSSPDFFTISQPFPLSSLEHLIRTPVPPVVGVPISSSPMSSFYATPPPSLPTTPKLPRRTLHVRSPSTGNSNTPSPGYNIASTNLNKLPSLDSLLSSSPRKSSPSFFSFNPFSKSYKEPSTNLHEPKPETARYFSPPQFAPPSTSQSTPTVSTTNPSYSNVNPWYLQTEFHPSPSIPPAGYCTWFSQSDSRESTPRRGDTSGEWGPRDPLPQPAPTTRGAEGLMSQGAAGSSSHTITETRVIEGSDDTTMQELLDKLAAEQRK